MDKSLDTPGKRIDHALLTLGLSDTEVAGKLGIRSNSVGRWRRLGEISDRVMRNMFVLEKMYGINLNWVKTGEGQPFLQGNSESADAAIMGYKEKYFDIVEKKKVLEEKYEELRGNEIQHYKEVANLAKEVKQVVLKYQEARQFWQAENEKLKERVKALEEELETARKSS